MTMEYINKKVRALGINPITHPHLKYISKYWETTDGKYTILYDEVGGFEHLRISRKDGEPIHNYMDIQEIKNDLFGRDVIAIQVFPKQEDFIRGSNTYHIWTWDGIDAPNLKSLYEYNNLNN